MPPASQKAIKSQSKSLYTLLLRSASSLPIPMKTWALELPDFGIIFLL